MKLTKENVTSHFESMLTRTRRDYVRLSQVKYLKTFQHPENNTRYIVDRCQSVYRVGQRIKTFERELPRLVLDAPVYSPVKLENPFIVEILNNEIGIDQWQFNVGYCFREALGLRYVQRRSTDKETRKLSTFSEWLQSPILKFSTGDLISHKHEQIMIQVEEGLPSGFVDTTIEHGMLRCAVYEFDSDKSKWTLNARYHGNQFDFLMVLIFGLGELSRFTELLNTSPENA
ncbi:MAG: hypothetical protein COB09_11210 [Thalassobium sp.]|nr:MAG: hypothetical protein COB09_11210 [Thalassobium sp.]